MMTASHADTKRTLQTIYIQNGLIFVSLVYLLLFVFRLLPTIDALPIHVPRITWTPAVRLQQLISILFYVGAALALT